MKFRLKNVPCKCTEEGCNCVPDVVLLRDGLIGYGQAVWVMDPKTNFECYAVEMLGWRFDASCKGDIADKLRQRISNVTGEAPMIYTY